MTPNAPLLTSTERLQQSRERMRQWLVQQNTDSADDDASLGASLRHHPLLASGLDALQGWWESHPWRPATFLAGGLVREALLPLARKHPLGLVLVAMMLGGSLVWFRPARGLVKSLLLKGVVSQSILGLAQQPFVGTLANALITWIQQLTSADKRPAP
jgi:hypothetical protein